MLDERSFVSAVTELCSADADLAAIVEQHGIPEFWAREPGFPTLVLLILEQQVSLASALAAFDRLKVTTGDVTPAAFLTLDDTTLREIGFSRQKAGYARELAIANVNPQLVVGTLIRDLRGALVRTPAEATA